VRSDDGGLHWRELALPTGFRSGGLTGIWGSGSTAVYLSASDGLYRTADHGASFQRVTPRQPGSARSGRVVATSGR
jgi:hypothetical protein